MSVEGSDPAGPEPGCPRLALVVPAALAGSRVDKAVALLAGLTRRAVAELVKAGDVRLDGRPVAARSAPVQAGQRLEVDVPGPVRAGPVPDPSVTFTVVHEDPELVVVDKPAGLVVHHGAGHGGGTLVDGLLARFPDLGSATLGAAGDPARPGIVHRLDKGTSGLLVVARTPATLRALTGQLRARTARRRYVVLAAGTVADDEGVIEAPVGRSARHRTRMAVTAGGRPARTTYRVLRRFLRPAPCSLLSAGLDTGRTHQIRVHLAAIGHPVVGDDRYGGAAARPAALMALMPPGRLFLHAAELSVDHPVTGPATWTSPLPPELAAVVDHLAD